MEDIRFRFGFWEFVISKTAWLVGKVIAVMIAISLVLTASIFVYSKFVAVSEQATNQISMTVQQAANGQSGKGTEGEPADLKDSANRFIKEYSTIEVQSNGKTYVVSGAGDVSTVQDSQNN